MPDDIALTIDGVEVKAKPGAMVLQAAMDAGIYIPYLCYYPGIKPFGACRMCVVEIEGGRGTPASCTTPVTQGMAVRTNTSQVVAARKGIMELLISEHPHGCLTCHRIDLCGPTDICLRHVSVNDRCVTCPKNERCELKDTVRHMEMNMDTPLTYNNRHLPQQVSDPFWEMDLNLCIVCARCVRVCDESRGDDALTLLEKSGRSLIGTSHGTSLLESGCEFCGACIDACPTGALVERDHKWEKAVKTITSTCPHCPVGCQMKLEVNKRDRLIRAIPERNAAANRGQACFKGKFGLDFVNRKERLKRPLIRRNGVLEEASWAEALDLVAQRLAGYKGGQYALIASPRGTNEDNYVAQKFARAIMGTNNVDLSSNTRPELVQPLGELLGYPAATNSIWELEGSACLLVVSSNMTEEQNVVAVPIKQASQRGAALIVIDQRETELTRYAKLWLRPRPGSETALLGGMLRIILDESLGDQKFLDDCCEGVEGLKDSLSAFDLPAVERITGVPHSQVQAAARLFASRRPGATLYALETIEAGLREGCVRALVDLALVTGNVGKPSSGLFPLFTGANEQGSKDVGCAPDCLPGHRRVADENARGYVQQAWNAEVPAAPGLALREITAAVRRGELKALHIIGNSPNFTNGELGAFLGALRNLELLVVHDTFATELAEFADVVLPSAAFAETEGTYTSLERRVQLLRPALAPRGEAKADWQILSQIAARMGRSGFNYSTASMVFDELIQQVEAYRGISYGRLQLEGVQWPCRSAEEKGTPILYAGGSGPRRARLAPLKLPQAPGAADPQFPLILAQGRVLHQPERPVEVVKVGARNAARREEIVEIHGDDARALGVVEGDWVEVITPQGRMALVVRVSGAHKGLISTTALFGQLITELERDKAPDPMLKVPGLPLLPARVVKAAAAAAN